MEKSFLNFKVRSRSIDPSRFSILTTSHSQAAHPEWIPTDPTGSLYLSRMADYSAAHPQGLARRRLYRNLDSTLQLDPTTPTSAKRLDPAEKAVEYDRALRMSRMRSAGAGIGAGSVLGQSRYPSSSSLFQSGLGGNAIAQTAILGDSHGSAFPSPQPPTAIQQSVIPEEDLMADGGVGSTLGESYVDGRRPGAGVPLDGDDVGKSQREEDEAMEDGGVLGLLAQIYGTGVNVKGRGRGPPRAI